MNPVGLMEGVNIFSLCVLLCTRSIESFPARWISHSDESMGAEGVGGG